MGAGAKMTWAGDELKAKVQAAVKEGITEACFLVQGEASRFCPVDTGRLRASLSIAVAGGIQTGNSVDAVSPPDLRPPDVVGVVGSNVEYALFVELNNNGKNAYLRPALHRNRANIHKLMQAKLAQL